MHYGTFQWRLGAAACAVLLLGALTARAAEQPVDVTDVAQPLLHAVQPAEQVDTVATAEDAATKTDQIEPEVIRERYRDGKTKIEREVVQDAEGNYVNHGIWKLWDGKGNVIAEGQYRYGQRHGTWIRWYRPTDSPLFGAPPYHQFKSPFLSRAEFQDGKLHGTWTIMDAEKNVISKWEFVKGVRDGISSWFYPNGQKAREVKFKAGVLVAQSVWKAGGELVREDTFYDGRLRAVKTTYYDKEHTKKKTEGEYLSPRIVMKTPDDWWSARPATFAAEGKEERHGTWSYWYPNGQLAQQGRFEYGLPVGKFTWWYSNGQKALEGTYQHGQPTGQWVWWHPNGQKKSVGQYLAGTPTGPWSWWRSDGKLTHRADFSEAAANIAARVRQNDSDGSSAKQPAPATPITEKPQP